MNSSLHRPTSTVSVTLLFALNTVLSSLLTLPVQAAQNLAPAQAAAQSSSLDSSRVIVTEVERGQSLMRNLEEMCDGIGARLTGSVELRRAQHWAMLKLQEYGATSVQEEAYDLGKAWQRGQSSARLLNASQQPIKIAQKAWTSASSKAIRAEVKIVNVRNLEELRGVVSGLKGKIILVQSLPRPSAAQEKNLEQYSREYNALLAEAQMAAILFVSEREGSLLDMSGSPNSRFKHNAGIISKQHANLLQRLIARGQTPQLEVKFGGGFSPQTTQAYNVIAEIRGAELPEEMVILGVHQDSWDLASGATDNGVGVVMAMEVLRTIRASRLPIKRSLRVVLFSGEEQGLLGSKAYVRQHAAELEKIQAMLTIDSGAGRIIGFPDMQVDAWYSALSGINNSVKELNHLDIVYGVSHGSDHESFFEKGIPAFSAMQEPLDYLTHTWHSEVDSVDHVKPEYLVHNAKILSLLSYALLNAEKLPQQAHRERKSSQ